ncbi:ankyrin repeat domain-containing protein [Roseibium album]|uniref:ankyrin repeat domain-containing protein n=1 Tax=Roseibium album TaxID=311410 RepID=UPI0032980236
MKNDIFYKEAEIISEDVECKSSLQSIFRKIRDDMASDNVHERNIILYQRISLINTLRKKQGISHHKNRFAATIEGETVVRFEKPKIKYDSDDQNRDAYSYSISHSFIDQFRKSKTNIALALEYLARFEPEAFAEYYRNNVRKKPPQSWQDLAELPKTQKQTKRETKLEETEPALHVPKRKYLDERDKSNWLDPTVVDALPFVGRDDETEQLNAFVQDDKQFLAWALSGPSGAGKTRLINHWFQKFETSKAFDAQGNRIWNFGFLTRDVQCDWKAWNPEYPTLIVIDYIHLFIEDLKTIFTRWAGTYNRDEPRNKIRLLLVDHIFPENLDKLVEDPRFGGIISSRADLNEKKSFFYNEGKPLYLQQEQQTEKDLRKIVSHAYAIFASDDVGDEELKSIGNADLEAAIDHLKETIGAWCPLFAALKGYAIAKGRSPNGFANRRDLIGFYLRSTNRLPWESLPNGLHANELGVWLGCMVAAATALRGVSYKNLLAQLPRETQQALWHQNKLAFNHCCYVISKPHVAEIGAFEPDIVGESFFLLLLEQINLSEQLTETLVAMLCIGEGTQKTEKYAEEFLEFFRRMLRNLANDDTLSEEVETYNAALLEILKPSRFPHGSSVRAAAATLLAMEFFENRDIRDSHSICIHDFYFSPKSIISDDICIGLILYWQVEEEEKLKKQEVIQKTKEQLLLYSSFQEFKSQPLSYAATVGGTRIIEFMLSHLGSYYDVNGTIQDGISPLIAASFNGRSETVDLLLGVGANVEQCTQESGETALMIASAFGYEDIVELLLKADSDVNKGRKLDGITALMTASVNNRPLIVRFLLGAGANVDQTSSVDDCTALKFACENGYLKVVELLLNAHADVNLSLSSNGMSALMMASQNGHLDVVKRLLSSQADANQASLDRGVTALLLACEYGHVTVASLLLEANAKINFSTIESGQTALMSACQSGHSEVVKLLLQADANIDQARFLDGVTALMLASQNNHVGAVKLLLDGKVNVNQIRSDNGMTAMMFASQNGHVEVVKLLLQARANVEVASENNGSTALMLASMNGHTEIVFLLLLETTNVDQSDFVHGWTALTLASANGHTEIVRLLLNADADVNLALLDNGSFPLVLASFNGHLEIIEDLLEANADVNQQTTDLGITALMAACYCGHIEIVKLLLRANADVDKTKYDDGFTAIMSAVLNNNVEIIELLLAKKAITQIEFDGSTRTALYLAADSGKTEALKALLKFGVNVDQMDTMSGFNALIRACSKGDICCVRELIRAGAKVDAETGIDGSTPLMWACQEGHIHIVELLIHRGAQVNFIRKSDGMIALHAACSHRRRHIAEFLVSVGANVNQCTQSGVTPLMMACNTGDVEIVKFLSGKKANFKLKDQNGLTAFAYACVSKNKILVEYIIDQGHLDLSIYKSRNIWSDLIRFIKSSSIFRIMRKRVVVEEIGTRIRSRTSPSFLQEGLYRKHLNTMNENGETPLTLAILEENAEMVYELIRLGADSNIPNSKGETPIQLARGMQNEVIIGIIACYSNS